MRWSICSGRLWSRTLAFPGNEAFFYGNHVFIRYNYQDALNKIKILKTLYELDDLNIISKNIILLNIAKIGLIIQKHDGDFEFENDLLDKFKKIRIDCPYYYNIVIKNDQMREEIEHITNYSN